MGFVPPLNLGGFQPSPATLAQWVYQIWQYLQENPIATQEQLQEYIGTFITTSPETQAMIGAGVKEYLTENPPTAPVKSVQGKTGAVQLAYNEIVPASNAVPVYKASSTPSTNTLAGQYNLGYRLFVNTATQEIFTISPAGALSLVGRGKFDGTTVDLNSAQGDTTISEAIAEQSSVNNTQNSNITTLQSNITDINGNLTSLTTRVTNLETSEAFSLVNQNAAVKSVACSVCGKVAVVSMQFDGTGSSITLGELPSGYAPLTNFYGIAVTPGGTFAAATVAVSTDGKLLTGATTANRAYRTTLVIILE